MPRRCFFRVASWALTVALLIMADITGTPPIVEPYTTLSSSHEERWSHTQQLLCPDMVPNSRAWPLLYHLARIELGGRTPIMNENEDDAISKFFEFHTGGAAYLSPNNRRLMAYLNIWKGGYYSAYGIRDGHMWLQSHYYLSCNLFPLARLGWVGNKRTH